MLGSGMPSYRRLMLLVAALLAVPPAGAAAQAPAGTARAAPSETPAGSGAHFVWRVARNGKAVAWLVGSVHVLAKDAYPLPAVFDQAFADTRTLIEEVDLGAAADPATVVPLASKALFTDGRTLSGVLDRETYALVEAKADAAGLPMLVLERMKPWLAAMTLAVPALRRAGFDPALGVDRHFYDRAQAAGRPVRGLETVAYQIERLDGLPMTVQVEMLRAVLGDVDTQVAAVGEIVTAWTSGDVAALERLLLKEFRASPEVYQRLLVERNRAWTPQIAACADEPAPCLVVVGGAHLVGPDSVVALLRQAGFSVDQH
jgi:uncharacterized protein